MPGLRSLRNRLAVIFALIIVGAIGTIYLSVTPRLEASLTSQRLDQVRATAVQYTADLAAILTRARRLLRPGRTRGWEGDATAPDPADREKACARSPSASAPRSS